MALELGLPDLGMNPSFGGGDSGDLVSSDFFVPMVLQSLTFDLSDSGSGDDSADKSVRIQLGFEVDENKNGDVMGSVNGSPNRVVQMSLLFAGK